MGFYIKIMRFVPDSPHIRDYSVDSIPITIQQTRETNILNDLNRNSNTYQQYTRRKNIGIFTNKVTEEGRAQELRDMLDVQPEGRIDPRARFNATGYFDNMFRPKINETSRMSEVNAKYLISETKNRFSNPLVLDRMRYKGCVDAQFEPEEYGCINDTHDREFSLSVDVSPTKYTHYINSTAPDDNINMNDKLDNSRCKINGMRNDGTYSDGYNVFQTLNKSKYKEAFSTNNEDKNKQYFDNTYLQSLRTRAWALLFKLQQDSTYRHWSENWKLLEKNLNKTKLLFQRLDESDADVAYVIDKGNKIKFRIRCDKYVPINIYQYVLYHEMAHMCTEELQHTPKFMMLLNILSLAAYECGFIDLHRISSSMYTSKGQPILCKSSIKHEILDGVKHIVRYNPELGNYYKEFCGHIDKF